MKFSILSAALFAAVANAVTLTTSTTHYTVSADSANALVVAFERSSCDITSLKYRGVEVQYQSTGSHIASGLGTATVTAQSLTSGGTAYVKITCTTSTLIHYYVIRDGDSALHMGTWVSAEPSVGELRWIGRFNRAVLPTDDVSGASQTYGYSSIVEGTDVFVVGGQTRSKFYSSQRFIDDQVHCLTGTDIKACMVMPGTAYESSSGGPFFRDINMNPDTSSNLYLYMNSNHAQTESYRMGFHGPYSCVFSRSGTPSATMDLSFMANMGLKDFVPAASRGKVSGTASGINGAKYQIVLHWYNSAAQYWVYASTTGAYTSPAMKPGTYTTVLYNGELKVATSSVTIKAGTTVTQDIASTWKTGTTVFQIGDWDSSPAGFRNARDQLRMHPSDTRNAAWGPLTYTVGTSAVGDFPMALFKTVNDPVTIKFTATAGTATLRIGTTISFEGGRPSVVVNGKALTVPAAPVKIDSRGVTRGTYRGRGEIYDWSVTLLSGANTITISVASGSSGTTYLNPNFVFDAIHVFT